MNNPNATTRHNPTAHHRRSVRLPGYDYSHGGAYFVTICTWDRQPYLGSVTKGEARMSLVGQWVEETWTDLPAETNGLILDSYVIMPNHLHALLWLPGEQVSVRWESGMDQGPRAGTRAAPTTLTDSRDGTTGAGDGWSGDGRLAGVQAFGDGDSRTGTLSAIVRRFKSTTSTRVLQARKRQGLPRATHGLWQKGYYEHVVRDEDDLESIRLYIAENPARWESDKLFRAAESLFDGKRGAGSKS